MVKFYVKRTKVGNKPVLRKGKDTKPFNIVGLLVGFKKDDKVFLGWSKRHKNDPVFRKDLATRIASGQATKKAEDMEYSEVIPHSFKNDIEYFSERLKKYFKVNDVVLPGEFYQLQ